MKRVFSLLVIVFIFLISVNANSNKDTLVIGYYPSAPFVIETSNGLDGISIWLWKEINKEVKQPFVYKKLTLDEVVNGIASHDIDLTINPLTITSKRSEVIDFSAPYYISNSTVMVPSVSSFEKGLQFISSFFSLNFLRAIGALFLVVFIFGFIAWLFERKKNQDEFGSGLKGLGSGIWWSAVTMTTVGYGDKSPKTPGGRVVGLVWMFAAIIIISGFTASIASSLTVNQLSWNQNSVDDFKEKKIAVIENSATEAFLEHRFFKKLKPFKTLEECRDALANGYVEAVSHDEPQLKYIAQLDTLGLYETLPISYNSQLYAFGFSESLSVDLKEQITVRLLEVTESTDWKVLLSEFDLLKD
ncbi:MAG: ligand-gated ion channel family protein [Salinivirgaceae bacterium]|nr:MAG: ligand-gated ion channel family protein [Salinivirgaceae bacterium]